MSTLTGNDQEGSFRYEQALERLFSLVDYERMQGQPRTPPRHDLGRMVTLLEELGEPHKLIPSIHIAGTKGKGSIAAMLTSALVALGHRTGMFTSPHLHTFRERLRIDGTPVTEKGFADLIERIWPTVEKMNQEKDRNSVTTFESLTAMALLLFSLEDCDWAVIETGLGGRLDATNVILPRLAIITSVSLDHTAILGEHIEDIAWEKAGIIKDGGTVICAPQQPAALEVIRMTAEKRRAKMVYVPDVYKWRCDGNSVAGQSFTVQGPRKTYSLSMRLLGDYQIDNAATAIAAMDELEGQGLMVQAEALITGFRDLEWPARMEVLARAPFLVIDGAHNPYSMSCLASNLRRYFDYDRLVVVVGWGADKDGESMAEAVSSLMPDVVVATNSRHPRSLTLGHLRELLSRHGLPVIVESATVEDAVRIGLSLAQSKDLVLVTGSLFVAAEGREFFLGIPPEIYPELLPAK